MANLPLAFGEILVGAIILDAGWKGASIADVVQGKATTHPLPTAGGSGGSSGGTGGSSGATNIPPGTYVNPIPGGSPSRIDAGGDYVLGSGGFRAPGRSKIVAVDTRHGFGNYIAAQLLDGPLAGTIYYVAEGIVPRVHQGQVVAAGTEIAAPSGGGAIEAGWGNHTNYDPLSHSFSGYSGDQSTQALTAGYSWSRFVHALGGPMAKFEGAGASLAQQIIAEFKTGHPSEVPY